MITNVSISGIHCDACLKLITRRVSTIPGVLDITVKKSGQTAINSDRNITQAKIQKALHGTDYKIITT